MLSLNNYLSIRFITGLLLIIILTVFIFCLSSLYKDLERNFGILSKKTVL
jgi:hypothetical protein